MHLSTAPLLVAEVPGCAQEELDRLARSVEARRQQLEEDINAYIARKQEELRRYESEVGQVMPHCRADTITRTSGCGHSACDGDGDGDGTIATVVYCCSRRLTRPSL